MGLPSGIGTIQVTGNNLCDLEGNPAVSGYVYFKASGQLADPTHSVIVSNVSNVSVVTNGVMTPVTMPVNDETVNPKGFTVNIRTELYYNDPITGVLKATPVIDAFDCSLPSTLGATVDIADLTPVSSFTPINGLTVIGTGSVGQALVSLGNQTADWQTVVNSVNGLTGAVAGLVDTAGTGLTKNGTTLSLSVPVAAANLPQATTTALGIAEFESIVANIAADGVPALGSNGKISDSGHVHPLPPWVFSVLAAGAKGDGQLDNTASITSGQATVTLVNAKFDLVKDPGKLFALKGGKSTGDTTLTGTIVSVQSTTQATLSVSATATITGAQFMWATDDTAAFQQAINSASAWGSLHGYGEIFLPSPSGLFYGIGGVLKNTDGTNAVFNSQLTVGVNSDRNNGYTLTFRGVGDAGQTREWNSQYPAMGPSTIMSFGVFSSSTAQTTSVTNGGNPSVIGGPTGKYGYGVGTPTPLFNNVCVTLENLTILTTHSASGWTYGAANFFGMARAHLRNFSYGTNGVVELYNGNSGDYTNVSTLSGGISIGVLMPANGNNASNEVDNVVCNGGYTYGFAATEHTRGRMTILYCWSGICPVGNYSDSGTGAVSALHAIKFDMLTVEACTYHVNVFGAGQSGIGPLFNFVMDTEGTIQFRDNPNNGTGLNAAGGEIKLVGSPSTVNLTYPTYLRIIKQQQARGPVATPSYALNTPQINTYWRDATVTFSGGSVTGVKLSDRAGGASSAQVTMTTLAGVTSGSFRVPAGYWWEIDGSVAPTSMQWVLD